MAQFGAVLTAMVTPFTADGKLDLDGAQKLARYLVDNGNDGVVVAGTTGESPTITKEEQRELFVAVREAIPGKPLVAGAGSNDTRSSIANTEMATEAGADAILVMAQDDEQLRRAPEAIDAPLVTFASLTQRSAAAWTDLGWRVVLDPFSAQVLAHLAVERFYRAALAGEPHEPSPGQIMAGYRDLPGVAGLEELYDIERATTEPGT